MMKKILLFFGIMCLCSCGIDEPLGPKQAPCNAVINGSMTYQTKFGRCFYLDGKKRVYVDKDYCDC